MDYWMHLTVWAKILNILLLSGGVSLLLIIVKVFLKSMGVTRIKKLNLSEDSCIEFGEATKNALGGDHPLAKKESLLNHRYFDYIESKRIVALYRKTSLDYKDIIGMAYVQNCIFKYMAEDISVFVCELEKQNGENINEFISVMNDIITKYEERAKSITIELNDTEVLIGIPHIYLSTLNNWMTNHITSCLEGMQDVLNDKYYSDWRHKASICLEYIIMMITLIIEDGRLTLSSLNGTLTKEIDEKKIKKPT